MPNAAGSVNINLSMNSATFTAGVKNAQAQLDAFSGKAKGAGRATVTSMQAASGAIREMNGNFASNTRAVEKFITLIPGVGSVLRAAFPLIGGLAFGSMLVEMGTKVAQFIKTANEMPKSITLGFGALNLSQKTATDELILSTDKAQSALDKMNHKPGTNGAKLAMDEAAVAADKLAASIEKSNASLNELLSKNHLSGWAILLNKQGTADREGTAKYFGQQSDSSAYDLANATTQQQTDTAKKALQDTQNAQLAEARSDLAKRQSISKEGGSSNDGANIAIDKGVITTILNQRKQAAAEISAAKTNADKQAAEDAKAESEQAKKAAHDRVEAMQVGLDSLKLQQGMSLNAVYDYWEGMKANEAAGGTAYNDIVKKQTQVAVEAATKAHETIVKAIADQKLDSVHDSTTGMGIIDTSNRNRAGLNQRTLTEQNDDAKDSNQLFMDSSSNSAREAEAKLATADMTRYAKAVELAAIHAAELKAALTGLGANVDIAQRTSDQANSNGNPDEIRQANKGLTQAQTAYANAQRQGQIQYGVDKQNINPDATSGLVGATNALDEFVNSTRDAAKSVGEFTTSTISGFNDVLLRTLTTRHTGMQTHEAFANYGAGLFRSVSGMALQKAEGSALGAFGLGGAKTLGASAATAMWVKSADSVAHGAASAASGISGFVQRLFGGGKGPGQSGLSSALSIAGRASAGDSANGGIGTIASSLTSLIPMFADGSPGSISGPAIVGERGPELFIPQGKGNVIPSNKMSQAGQSSGNTIHVDARGSNDPAQTTAAINRAFSVFSPHIINAAVSAVSDRSMRLPSSSR